MAKLSPQSPQVKSENSVTPPEPPLTVTVGRGLKNPHGKPRNLNGEGPPARQLATLLESLPGDEEERWWAPTIWTSGHRRRQNWVAASAIVLDLDYYDAAGGHSPLPPETARALLEAAREGRLPGSLTHLTPRGARIVFSLDVQECDRDHWKKAARGAVAQVQSALDRLGLSARSTYGKNPQLGFAPDAKAAVDLARMFWAPRTVVSGARREAEVVLLREEPFRTRELAVHSPGRRRTTAAAKRELALWYAKVRQTVEGRRNDTLNRAAFELGQMVSAGVLDRVIVEEDLRSAAQGAGLGIEEAEATIRSGIEAGMKEPRACAAKRLLRDDGRPTFLVSMEDIPLMVAQAELVLVENRAAGVFQRGLELVHVVHDGVPPRPGLKRPLGAPIIRPLAHETLRAKVSESSRWVRVTKDGEEYAVAPPQDLAPTLAKQGEWRLIPYLADVVNAPTIREDGSILEEPGYDETSGLLYEPGANFPPLPEIYAGNARDVAARAAAALLDEVYAEFPFADPREFPGASRAATLSLLLTLVARHAIPGPTPLHGSTASTAGTGKGLLVKVSSLIATGRLPYITPAPRKDEEMSKLLLTLGAEGAPCAMFDNVVAPLGSPSLSAALTAEEFKGRGLGFNKSLGGVFRTVLCATGNNMTYQSDTGRRVVPIRQEAEWLEDPESRTFRIRDLAAHVREHRARLYVLVLTVLRAFFVAGQPQHDKKPMGSFEAWDRIIRAACIWIDVGDPCGGRDDVRQNADPERDLLRQFHAVVGDLFGVNVWTVAELIAKSADHAPLRDILVALQPHGDGDTIDSSAIGYKLRAWKTRTTSLRDAEGNAVWDRRLVSAGKRQGLNTWRIEEREVRHA